MTLLDFLAPRIHVPNPGYPASDAEVERMIKRMEASPVGLERPLVILSGWRATPFFANLLARRLRRCIGAHPDRIASVAYFTRGRIPACARIAIDRVGARFGMADETRTTQVDVVGISMGGLVAWSAAEEGDGKGRRLAIARLFTLATPWQGAGLAKSIRVDAACRDMRPGSPFLQRLEKSVKSVRYPIVPYAVLRDEWVGPSRSAPRGSDPIWVPGRIYCGHHLVSADRRILADLARRLRGDQALARPCPLPGRR